MKTSSELNLVAAALRDKAMDFYERGLVVEGAVLEAHCEHLRRMVKEMEVKGE